MPAEIGELFFDTVILSMHRETGGDHMGSNPWKNMFPPHIWQRGVDYYRDGRVLDLQCRNHEITAEVEGSEIYTVSVTFGKGNSSITGYSCDCPYGEDGTPCKHLAAVLCAVQDEQRNPVPKEESGCAVEEMVGLLSESQMRSLLIRFAEENSRIREVIYLTATNELPQSQKNCWEADLEELTDSVADRHGFIDYEDASEYCDALVDYMNDRLPDLLSAGKTMDAFQLTWLTFQTGMEQDMDDSDGGLSILASYCMDAWSEILEQANLEEQQDILRWFAAHYASLELGRMFLDMYLYDAPWKDEIGSELLSLLDQQIQACLKSEIGQYRLENLIVYRVEWMERIGKCKEEQEQYFSQYHYLPRVREIQISQAMQTSDWDTTLALLEESKKIDENMPGLVAKYCTQMIEVYKKTDNREALLAELRDYLYHFRQDNLVYASMLKAMLSADEWTVERVHLLDSPTMSYQVYPLLEQEQMYEELMQRIEKKTDIFGLEKYEHLLRKTYEQRCKNVYITYLQNAMEQASNRKAYWSVIQILKKVRKYPDGKTAAQDLADCWKAKYPRRTSMLDELRKAGF